MMSKHSRNIGSMTMVWCALWISTSHAFTPTGTIRHHNHHRHTPMTTKTTLSPPHPQQLSSLLLRPNTSSSSSSLQSMSGGGTTPPSMPSIDTSSLLTYLLETVISYGVPALFTVAVLLLSAKLLRGPSSSSSRSSSRGGDSSLFDGPNRGLFRNPVAELYEDLYDDNGSNNKNGPAGLLRMFGGDGNGSGRDPNAPPKNLGIPQTEYLTVTSLNTRYSSYEYTLTKAIDSKARAANNLRLRSFRRALNKAVSSSSSSIDGSTEEEITASQRLDLLAAEKEFLKEGAVRMQELMELQRTVTDLTLQEEMEVMDVDVGQVEVVDTVVFNATSNTTEEANSSSSSSSSSSSTNKRKKKKPPQLKSTLNEIKDVTNDILQLELTFLRTVLSIMGPSRANAIRAALLGNIDGGGDSALPTGLLRTLQDRPLSTILDVMGYTDTPDERSVTEQRDVIEPIRNVFVTEFPGDVTASQVEFLREETTAIVRAAKPGDEALIVLQSGGGTVTGYGLAAAQLQRFRSAGMKLTICVEQVAASGGYMMCCVADRIVASPFAVLGSIGVIGEVPNAYERLKKEGIEFQTVTAGKYKRTLTPTKKVTQEDIDKQKEDLEGILRLFKDFVKTNRPSLDIDDVATGETWFGQDALDKGLCDDIMTVDDVLSQYVDIGHNVYDVKYTPPPEAKLGALSGLLPAGGERQEVRGVAGRGNGGGGGGRSVSGGIVRSITRLLLENVVPVVRDEIMAELESGDLYKQTKIGGSDDVRKRYMVRDPSDTVDRIRID